MQGIVVKILPNQFEVLCNGNRINATAKGKLKLGRKIMLGDIVEIENAVICAIGEQKNYLVRPECCNIDNFVIILACEPEPDFYLTDLLIAMCLKQKINVLICINKDDINEKGFIHKIKEQYSHIAPIEVVSAKLKQGTNELKQKLKNVTAFAGQSGVGKTSLINCIFNLNLAVGDLSKKLKRGANTTTSAYFHVADGGKIVVDTPGFSFLDIKKIGLTPEDFKNSFTEFENLCCKYSGCSHTGEDGCNLDYAVECGKVCSERAQRYRETYKKLYENHKRRFS